MHVRHYGTQHALTFKPLVNLRYFTLARFCQEPDIPFQISCAFKRTLLVTSSLHRLWNYKLGAIHLGPERPSFLASKDKKLVLLV